VKHAWTRWPGNPPPHELTVEGWWGDMPEYYGEEMLDGITCYRKPAWMLQIERASLDQRGERQ
jgi:hypothetical protein